jgi:hypothetical protein
MTMPADSSRMIDRRCTLYEWFIDLGAHPNIITDGTTRKLEDLIQTTIPYHCSKEEKAIWLDRGLTIRRQTGKPWMVLLTFRPRLGRELAARNRKPRDFFRPISPIILFPVTTMHFLTNPVKAGTREWAKCACWVLVRRAQFRFCYGGMCLVLSDDPKICSD